MTTTEGSIVAYIGADDDDYQEKMRRAQETAERLGRTDPTVTVHVNADEALAKLEAMHAEAERLGMATQNSGPGALMSGGANQINWLAVGIAALIPTISSLAGFLAAVGGEFAGMGAAGILAVKGINDEMAAGTVIGDQYRTGLDDLKGNLDTLSQVAAVSMMSAFGQAVHLIDNAMPHLNDEIARFSAQLGAAGVDALGGLVNVLQDAEPLLNQAGVYIDHIAAGFLAWTQNGGLQQFLADAQSSFPVVAQTVEDVARAVMDVVGALAPLGPVMLGTLDVGARLVSLLTNGLTPGLIAAGIAAGGFYLAAQRWSGLGPLLEKTTGGVIGLSGAMRAIPYVAVALGISDIGGQLADVALNAVGATKSVDDLRASFSTLGAKGAVDNALTGGLFGNNSDLSGELKSLTSNGVFSDIQNNLDGVMSSFRQWDPTSKFVDGAINPLRDNLKSLDTTMAQMVTSGHSADAAAMFKELASKTDGSKDAIGRLRGLLPDYTTAANAAKDATEGSAVAAEDAATAYMDQGNQASKLQQAIKNLLTVMDQSSTNAQDAIAANATWQQGLASLTDEVKKNGTTLDQGTAKGAENAAMLSGLAGDAEAAAQAQLQVDKGTMGAKAAAEKYAATLADQRQKLIDSATAAGFSRDQVQKLADTVLHMPTQAEIDVIAQTAGARNAITQFIQAMNGQKITLSVVANGTAAGPHGGAAMFSSGGPVYAASGMFIPQGTDTVPAMLTPGEMVIRQKSAAHDPQFLSAYNDDPERALAGVRAQGQGKVEQHFHVTGTQQTEPNVLGAILGIRAARAFLGMPGIGR